MVLLLRKWIFQNCFRHALSSFHAWICDLLTKRPFMFLIFDSSELYYSFDRQPLWGLAETLDRFQLYCRQISRNISKFSKNFYRATVTFTSEVFETFSLNLPVINFSELNEITFRKYSFSQDEFSYRFIFVYANFVMSSLYLWSRFTKV